MTINFMLFSVRINPCSYCFFFLGAVPCSVKIRVHTLDFIVVLKTQFLFQNMLKNYCIM